MVTIKLGNKKKSYKSIRLAANETGIPYMTLYMRLRTGAGGLGWNVAKAVKKPVRVYNRKESV